MNAMERFQEAATENERLAVRLAEAQTLITTLRGVITEQAQKVEDLERAAHQEKLVREKLVEALMLASRALSISKPTHSYYPEPVAQHAAARQAVEQALTASGVKL